MELANAARHAPMSVWPNRTAAWMHDTQYWGHMNNGESKCGQSVDKLWACLRSCILCVGATGMAAGCSVRLELRFRPGQILGVD